MFGRLFRKKSFDTDLEEELQAHLDIETGLLMERGLSRDEALGQARRSFGNRTQIAESARESWGWSWLDRFSQDFRYAARTLRHSPVFAVAAVLSLGLGIGASTAVFSIADTIFLRPLPYAHAEQLMWVATKFSTFGEFLTSPDYVEWRRDNTVFQQLAATGAQGGGTMLLNGTDPTEVHAVSVSANFLRTLGVRPALGRDFTPSEELPNGSKAVLLSHKLWQHRFGGKLDVVDQILILDGQSYTVAGVLPASFVFPIDVTVDVMTTLPVPPTASHHDRSMGTWAVYGRLKNGVSLSQAQANLQQLFARAKADMPMLFRSDTTLVVQPLQQHRIGDGKLLLSILLAAVSCLLLISCLNVSNLRLARWSSRSGEFAVRAAIGAGRARLVRQLITEAILLVLLGCALGSILVAITLHGFVRYAEGELPRLSEVTFDVRVLAIGIIVSLVTTLICATLPVLRAGRIDIQSALQDSARASAAASYVFAKRVLVVAEVALSLILLSGAALLVQSLWHLRNDRLGFQPEHVMTVTISLKGTKSQNRNRDELAESILSFVRRVPGTEGAAQADCTPLTGGRQTATFSRSDRALPEAFARGARIYICGADAGYARASGIRIVRGRFFTKDDFLHPNTVVVINEAAARTYFPGEDPIGKRIMGKVEHQWKTVLGVVSDTKNTGLDAEPQPQAFVNSLFDPQAEVTQLQLIVRSIADRQSLEAALAKQIRTFDPGLVVNFASLDETIGDMTSGPRFNGILMTTFASVALVMAVIGVYGLLTLTVTQRTHEIGIRIALGAQRARIVGPVLQEGTSLVLIGLALGCAGVFSLTRYLKSILYGVSATDLTTLLIVGGGLFVAALIAMSLPARKAASIDPMVALRHY
jgi:putative ABC transport system permease protein